MVKQYLQLIDMCNFRKYYVGSSPVHNAQFAERTKVLQYNNILMTPGVCSHESLQKQELSSAINYLYRLGLNRMIVQTYNYYERSNALALFNTVSVKYAMLSAAQLKDPEKVHTIYNSIMQYRKNNIILRCKLHIFYSHPTSNLCSLSSLAERGEGSIYLDRGDKGQSAIPQQERREYE